MKNDEKLNKHAKKLKHVAGIGIGVDTAVNAASLYGSLTVNGNGLIAIIACVIFALFWFNCIYWAISFGIEILTNAEEEKKYAVLPLWTGLMVIVLAISIYMSVAFFGLDLAKKEYQQESIARVLEVESIVSKQHATAMGLESVLEASSSNAQLLKELEIKDGGVSSKRGIGEVSSLLASLEIVLAHSHNQIIKANGQAEPIKRDISELKEDIRRISSNQDLDYEEKTDLLKEKIELLSLSIKKLQQNIPLNSLTNAIDAMARDFKATGINDLASQRIASTFHPISTRLSRELGSLKEASRIEIPSIRHLSDYELLAQAKSMIPIFAIAFILASMPLGLTFCMFLISPTTRTSQGNSSDEDHETADSVSSLRMKSNSTKH